MCGISNILSGYRWPCRAVEHASEARERERVPFGSSVDVVSVKSHTPPKRYEERLAFLFAVVGSARAVHRAAPTNAY